MEIKYLELNEEGKIRKVVGTCKAKELKRTAVRFKPVFFVNKENCDIREFV